MCHLGHLQPFFSRMKAITALASQGLQLSACKFQEVAPGGRGPHMLRCSANTPHLTPHRTSHHTSPHTTPHHPPHQPSNHPTQRTSHDPATAHSNTPHIQELPIRGLVAGGGDEGQGKAVEEVSGLGPNR